MLPCSMEWMHAGEIRGFLSTLMGLLFRHFSDLVFASPNCCEPAPIMHPSRAEVTLSYCLLSRLEWKDITRTLINICVPLRKSMWLPCHPPSLFSQAVLQVHQFDPSLAALAGAWVQVLGGDPTAEVLGAGRGQSPGEEAEQELGRWELLSAF